MTTRRSGPKAPRRPNVPAVTDVSGGQGPPEQQCHPAPLDRAPSLIERIETQREQLFKALSIVQCCKNASATLYDVDDCEYMVPAFDVLYDLLDTSAGELAQIMRELDRAMASEPGHSPEGSGAE
jgi:hypothetical protein